MVPSFTIFACIVTLLISLILPPAAAMVYAGKNRKQGVGLGWLLGAVGFVVPQMLIRLPILNLLSANARFLAFAQSHPLVYSLGLAFTAGLFELAGRYAVAMTMRNRLTYQRSLAAGMGHGGIEAMLLVGLTYVNNLVLIFQIQSGSFDALLAQTAALGGSTAALEAARQTMVTASGLWFLLAGVERLLTMVFHTAMSLLVCYSVHRRRPLVGMLICLGLHTAVDSVVGLSLVMDQTLAAGLVYLVLTAAAAVSVWMILVIRRRWKEEGQ